MRILTAEEVEAVSGGDDGPPIVVVGHPPVDELPDDPQYHGNHPKPIIYGSKTGATYDSSNGLWHLPAHMTASQIIAVAFNEAKGVDANHRLQVMEDIIHVILNNDGRSFEAASPLISTSGADRDIVNTAIIAYDAAKTDAVDPTHGSTSWIMRTDANAGSNWLGLTSQLDVGPFTSAGTSFTHVDFFKDPAYAH